MNRQGPYRAGQLPPRFKELMQGCRQMARSLLAPLYVTMLDNTDVALLEFAEKAESNTAQGRFFEAMQELKRKRMELEQVFFKAVDAGFRDFINGSISSEGTLPDFNDLRMSKLSLVDKGEVEETLPVQNMVAKANANYSEQLYGLHQRLAVINGGAKLEAKHVPGGIAQLAYAARDAFRELQMDGKTRMVIYAVFERYVMRELHSYLDEYNRRLVNAGVLPNLRYEIRKQIDPRKVKAESHATATEPSGLQLGEPASALSGQFEDIAHDYSQDMTVGEETFAAIRELLAGRHQHPTATESELPNAAGGLISQATAERARQTIIGALGHIQSEVGNLETVRRFNDEIIEKVAVDRALLERVKKVLIEERRRLYGGVDRRQIASADADVIDLVGMLFEFMLQDEQLPNSVKALLSRLHTPYLKVAMLDKQLFTERHHPARRLLDAMADAGTHWVNEEDLERGIFPSMRRIVERTLIEFNDDIKLFEDLLDEFSAQLREVEQKAEVIERRAIEAADGQARLQFARKRAHEEINARLQHAHICREAQDFMRQVWVEKLTFILLRERAAEHSEPWQLALELADRIIWSLDLRADAVEQGELQEALPTLRANLRDGLEALRAYGRRDNDRLFDMLCEWQDEALAVPQAQFDTATQDSFEALEPVKPVESAPLTEDEQRFLDSLGEIKFNTWFEFADSDSTRVQRRKLAWYSKISSNYMFVDAMGVKAAELTRNELARKLYSGQARILNLGDKPFIERTMEHVLSWLGRNKSGVMS